MLTRAKLCFFLLLAVLSFIGTACQAAVYYVQPAGNNVNNGTSWTDAKATVQAALDQAQSTDQVWVAAGTYNERISLKSGVALYGGFVAGDTMAQRDPSTKLTILDGGAGGSVVTAWELPNSAVINGFTIRNGSASYGGGIYCRKSNITIAENTLSGNNAKDAGGAIWLEHCSAVVQSNTISNNTANVRTGGIHIYEGNPTILSNTIDHCNGAIFCDKSNAKIYNNNIHNNTSTDLGSVILVESNAPLIYDNTITNNAENAIVCTNRDSAKITGNTFSGNGNGIICYDGSTALIMRNTIKNSTSNGIVIFGNSKPQIISNWIINATYSGIAGYNTSCPTIINNTFYGNRGGVYMNGECCPTVANNLFAKNSTGICYEQGTRSPRLLCNGFWNQILANYYGIDAGTSDFNVTSPGFINEAGLDFHLEYNSPFIGRGTNIALQPGWTDIDGNYRVQGSLVDVGADEATQAFSSTPSVTLIPGGCIVKWNTPALSTSQVEYGLTSSYGMSASIKNQMVLDHSVTFMGLLPHTTYHYRVHSIDSNSIETISPDNTFTTMSALQDWPCYMNDFESGCGTEWSNTKIDTTPIGSRKFLGQFSNETVSLNLGNLPTHGAVTLDFDFYAIRTWDGNAIDFGPDLFQVSLADGRDLLYSTFSDFEQHRQSYPSPFPGILNKYRQNATERASLGYVNPANDNHSSVYRMSFTFPHSGSTLQINFKALGLQAIDDESWGLDNVAVTLTSSMPADSIAPDTFITSTPQEANGAIVTPAVFHAAGFDDTTPLGFLRYQWRLDGGTWSSPVSDPSIVFNTLTPGYHLFEIAAIDQAGNVDPTPAVWNYKVPANNPISSFDSGTDDWHQVELDSNCTTITMGPITPQYSDSGGNPGSYIYGWDLDLGIDTWYWSAPSKFLGDQSAALHGSLEFDRKEVLRSSWFSTDPSDVDVILIGDTGTGSNVLVYGHTPDCPNDWTHFSVPLSAGEWKVGRDGRAATEEELKSVLSNVQALYILGELTIGYNADALDNVSIVAEKIPPVITNIRISPDSVPQVVTILWNTDEPSTSQVDFYINNDLVKTTPIQQELVLSHSRFDTNNTRIVHLNILLRYLERSCLCQENVLYNYLKMKKLDFTS